MRPTEFDDRAARHRLVQFSLGGRCENPFDKKTEQQLIKIVEAKIGCIPKWIRSLPAGRRVWSASDRLHASDLCRIHTNRIVRRIRSEYRMRRAEFIMKRKSLRAAETIPRLSVNLHRPQAIFDGTEYKFSPDGAVFIKALACKLSDWVSGAKLDISKARELIESSPREVLPNPTF